MTFKNISLRVEGGVGSTIENVLSDMCRMSHYLGISVVCDWNQQGDLLVFPSDTVPGALERWRKFEQIRGGK